MLRTDVIYRVVYSPTEASYAHIMPGPGEPDVTFYPSAKRAKLLTGLETVEVISEADFIAGIMS